jgi:hypothetical protein
MLRAAARRLAALYGERAELRVDGGAYGLYKCSVESIL